MKMIWGFVGVCLGTALYAQESQHAMPPGVSHEEHQRQMQKRGAAAMGFDQDTTVHRFLLSSDGGAIEVRAKDPADTATCEQIRRHLHEIAGAFADGDFSKPFITHAEMPPGVAVMQQRKAAIRYAFEELPSGGRVRITTHDATAQQAIHEFLRYQIREHGTGDPTKVPR